MKRILSTLILLTLFLTGCSNEPTYWGDIAGDDGEHIGLTLYGKYTENIPENYVTHTKGLDEVYSAFRADAENIYEAVKTADLTGYQSGLKNFSILQIAEDGELRAKTRIYINEVPINVLLTYNIEERDGRWEPGYVGVDPIYMNYFPEPIVGVSFNIPSTNNINKLLYTVDGELVGEYYEWFMFGENCDETIRDELAEFYFNEALRIIGK